MENNDSATIEKDREEQKLPVLDHRLIQANLGIFDWMGRCRTTDISPIVEVQFKNSRKSYFLNTSEIALCTGDVVAVEAALGHDIGTVSLTGPLVAEQMRIKRYDTERNPLRKIYRIAKPHDIEKWHQAIALENDTMIQSRQISARLGLEMKIGDVEYQGDKTKAIFYYIADGRVDFRELIKVLADTFHIRIEMKQIGARQEAGRIGGFGPCGRGLCCSSFITNFVSVSTASARYQDLSLNPQKLAGQCGKLKCCLNYEVDTYLEAQKAFPAPNSRILTGEGTLYHQKNDIFSRTVTYTPDKEGRETPVKLSLERAQEIIWMNKKGQTPEKALVIPSRTPIPIGYTDGVGEDSLERFDARKGTNPKKKKHRNKHHGNRPATSENAPANNSETTNTKA